MQSVQQIHTNVQTVPGIEINHAVFDKNAQFIKELFNKINQEFNMYSNQRTSHQLKSKYYVLTFNDTLHMDELRAFMFRDKPTVMVLTEMHITMDIYNTELQISNSKYVSIDSDSPHTGGCVMYMSENLNFTVVQKVAVVSNY